MRLADVLKDIEYTIVKGNVDVDIRGICYDSRNSKDGSMFVAIKGFKSDGADYIGDAIERGAVAVLVDGEISIDKDITLIKVQNTRKSLAKIASNYYGDPSKQLFLIGVTGTNGKTSVTYMIKSILESQNNKVGLIGTIQNMIGDKVYPTERTTPESLDLQRYLRLMVDEGVKYVVMEVSSHSLALNRVDECDFDIAVFTNLTQDHLDFHKTMDDYANAKAKLFRMAKTACVINIDDDYSSLIIENSNAKVVTYGIKDYAYIMAKDIKNDIKGAKYTVQIEDIKSDIALKIPGLFSVYNSLAAISVAFILGIPLQSVKMALKDVKIKGRFEVLDIDAPYNVVIDYAHTPDGLENLMKAFGEYDTGRKILLFGCGGDRDKGKRPKMGEVAGKYADFVIITSDNPRSEDPMQIISEIEMGIKNTNCPYKIIENRKEAIKYALSIAKDNDIVILAGKGHETYQVLKDRVIDFDEREIVKEILNGDEKN
ncbi:UDP-N-acetylmuramoyl-L-alanyl-D-glutamate--2,6-diaminopimelate ligase [Thermoanaerobacterium thermosaccharolyticum]|jgi:UDP-N-acetylmuramoyl-L-alanyl-D-glutamate--2,6-diaminopimelate ligase|uniref:UDP-N-acetylmuramoyl-L-alanyl-D-glutamate--2, 6-diaminopimelate ligase n=1 Tax=Thermoanaerobacterium thermosaccharolyticum TaxID=1517 RepID=UPI00123A07F2|nr:UDP-N-acetylmuramoyl-L-alanyl-D-glutamate--2,6-diaminopimelate ligase [Thermoanaerobacterium thermosaccharolyticum]KAA5807265.1 UDP-N-acetylmuramoyl-L-alanyl-D-glutamate--2,6-diaminopimelate ligase [Thermoanaerobacterium thermosaccharolyticum]MBE0069010.1 UDP-N-acetylmuramoyl-L-alanyl-D-glutamate--2,6-diaminopimelate ligase [Thermoanaerobacterium thermosaccharolyticum]MBE0227650.1 UDP-N-acetylmuramoyl-L-alanyl-D-glutamate--2,6-diaminopimelate ligase [Thermoanaerobacterium thermosaccharolyticu